MNQTLISSTKEQIVRGLIIKLLEQTGSEGGSLELLQIALKQTGHELTTDKLLKTLTYLADKGLVRTETVENKVLGIKRHITKLTAKATDLLEGTIIIDGIILPEV